MSISEGSMSLAERLDEGVRLKDSPDYIFGGCYTYESKRISWAASKVGVFPEALQAYVRALEEHGLC